MGRTAIVWSNGERYVFHGEQCDRLLEIGRNAETPEQAWDAVEDYGEQIDA